jgi:hypothetical protein
LIRIWWTCWIRWKEKRKKILCLILVRIKRPAHLLSFIWSDWGICQETWWHGDKQKNRCSIFKGSLLVSKQIAT